MHYKIPPALNGYQLNIHSQNGEDGVIEEILTQRPPTITDARENSACCCGH